MTRYASRQRISYILPWIQWFHIYALFPGVTIGYAIIVLVDIYWLFAINKLKITTNKKTKLLWLFFAYALITLPIAAHFADGIRTISIANRIIKVFFLLWLLSVSVGDVVDWNCYIDSLRIITFISCFVIAIQFFMYLFMGKYLNFKIPFLKYSNENTNTLVPLFQNSSRLNSIFTEPSHFVFFAMQYLIISLFNNPDVNKKNIIHALLVSLSVILCISSTGIILLCIIWFLFLLSIYRRGIISSKMILVSLLVIVAFAIGAYLVFNSELYLAIERLGGSFSTKNTVWKRIYANMDRVFSLKGVPLFFGNGMGNIDSEFMNSFVYTILNVGIIGLIILLLWLIRDFFRTGIMGKVAIVVFVLLCEIDMVFYTPTLISYAVIWAHSERRQKA